MRDKMKPIHKIKLTEGSQGIEDGQFSTEGLYPKKSYTTSNSTTWRFVPVFLLCKVIARHHGIASLRVSNGGDGPQMWKVAGNILN